MIEWMLSPAGGVSLSPALVAIFLALVTRRVEPALAFGVVLGGLVAAGGDPLDAGRRIAVYAGGALGWEDGAFAVDHIEIAAFSLIVGVAVAVLSEAGATRAVIRRVERIAKGRRGAMVSTWLGGLVVFFDDYANCLVVGNAMGPLADRYGVSRQKLAYIVDSTAAPIASLAIVSTWVGYEVGLLADQLPADGPSAFSVFLASVPYRFYSLFTLVFVGAIALSGRDFGPMWHAEADARRRVAQEVVVEDVDDGTSPWLAIVPVGLLVGGTLGWLVVDGWIGLDATARTAASAGLGGATGLEGRITAAADVLGAANAYHAMFFGSVLAIVTAFGGTLATSKLSSTQAVAATKRGLGDVAPALLVLFLAWALSNAMGDTGSSTALTGLIDGRLPAWALPASTFLLAAATAFATGTSFGTMGILIPIAVPVALQLAPGDLPILYATTSAVLAGSCMGDHASPISDTTILSSVGAGVSLMEHVRTQAPYALASGTVAILMGYLPVGLGVPLWVCLLGGAVTTVAVVMLLGRPVPAGESLPQR